VERSQLCICGAVKNTAVRALSSASNSTSWPSIMSTFHRRSFSSFLGNHILALFFCDKLPRTPCHRTPIIGPSCVVPLDFRSNNRQALGRRYALLGCCGVDLGIQARGPFISNLGFISILSIYFDYPRVALQSMPSPGISDDALHVYHLCEQLNLTYKAGY
jgi:hypothetical protein